MPSTTRSASRTSLPALLLLSVLGAGAILALIGLFPVLALASVPEEVAAESPAPEPSGELPALPSTGEQQPGGQPPDEWQRELGERPRAGLDPQAAAASLGETAKPPVEGGSGSGSDVVQTGAPAGGQQRPDLITPTAPLHALVENNPVEAPAPVANADDDKDPDDDKKTPPPTLEGAQAYWHQELADRNAKVQEAHEARRVADAVADDVGAWGNADEIAVARQRAAATKEATIVAAEDATQARDSAYAYDVMAAMHGVAGDAEAADNVTWSRYKPAKGEEYYLRARMAKDLAAANNIPDPGERAAALKRLAEKQAELDARWAVTEKIIQHHQNMVLVPEYATRAAQEAEEFRISAWHANDRERLTRKRIDALDDSLRASTHDTYYLEDARAGYQQWAQEGADAREKELRDVEHAVGDVRNLLSEFRPSKAPDLAARYGIGEDGILVNWWADTTRRASVNGSDNDPPLREPAPLYAGYARSREPVTVMRHTGPGGDAFVATGEDEILDVAGHRLRRLLPDGQVVSRIDHNHADYHLDGVEPGGQVELKVPDFADPWSGRTTVLARAGEPVSFEIPRTLHPVGGPLRFRHELVGFSISIGKSGAERGGAQAADPAWEAHYVRQTADTYVPDARTAKLIREHPELGLPHTVSRAAGAADVGTGIRPTISREGEEVLRIQIQNPRLNTWVTPEWEHAPATGYENPSEGHEAGR